MVGYCNQQSIALTDNSWTINTYLADTTTTVTTTPPSTVSLLSPLPTTTTIATPGKSFTGGFFTLFYLSSDSNYAYYNLFYTFTMRSNSFISLSNCTTNSQPNIIQLFNTSDFAVNCQSGCTSPQTNSSLLGYMNGLCLTSSPYMNWEILESSYKITANLSSPYFEIVNGPQNLNYLDWVPLMHYYNNIGGFNFYSNHSLVPRSDTGLINSPPLVLINPVLTIQLQNNYLEEMFIYIEDANEDTIQCEDCLFYFILIIKYYTFYLLYYNLKVVGLNIIQPNVMVIFLLYN